jgi:integrase
MPKLTKRFVESLRAGAVDQVIFDEELPGFGLRLFKSGKRSYVVQYRNAQGRSRRMTLGLHGKITAEEARLRAQRIFAKVRDGADPVAARIAFLEAPTVDRLLDRYLTEHVERRNRRATRPEIRRLIDRHVRPVLGKLKVEAVTRQDMTKLHHSLVNTPRQANLVLAYCSKAFALAEEWGMRSEGSNPCRRITRNPESHRERYLTPDELARLSATLRVAETTGLPWTVNEKGAKAKHLAKPENRCTLCSRVITAAIELLAFTGCRLSEVLNLRWDYVDLKEGLLVLPETKAGKRQTVLLNKPAQEVLKELKATKLSEWVLPSQRDPARPLAKDWIEAKWQRIRLAANISDVRLHDLRHTVGTVAAQIGANGFLIRDLLRHRDLATTGRYVHQDLALQRKLSEVVGERIVAAMAGPKSESLLSLFQPLPVDKSPSRPDILPLVRDGSSSKKVKAGTSGLVKK